MRCTWKSRVHIQNWSSLPCVLRGCLSWIWFSYIISRVRVERQSHCERRIPKPIAASTSMSTATSSPSTPCASARVLESLDALEPILGMLGNSPASVTAKDRLANMGATFGRHLKKVVSSQRSHQTFLLFSVVKEHHWSRETILRPRSTHIRRHGRGRHFFCRRLHSFTRSWIFKDGTQKVGERGHCEGFAAHVQVDGWWFGKPSTMSYHLSLNFCSSTSTPSFQLSKIALKQT
jgi:hypothetical protein